MRNLDRIILSYRNAQRSFKSLNETLLVNQCHDFFKKPQFIIFNCQLKYKTNNNKKREVKK